MTTPTQDGAGDYEPPAWMEPFLPALGGRQEVVRLMTGGRAVVWINAPLALLQQGMEEQVRLLHRLRSAGLLAAPPY